MSRPRALSAALGLALAGCVSTPREAGIERVESRALAPVEDGELARLFGAPAAPGPSRFAPVDRSDDALDLRLALVSLAERSIDAQSYLWHEDPAGALLFERLLEAADDGVRVRLLIDGFRLEGAEELDAALAAHPNLELRVFNPTLHRAGLWQEVELAEHLARYDHRMHNKQLLVDGVAAVFGGRNVGGEYFGLGEDFDFRDFDLLASGPVLRELERSFDAFWNSEWAIPLDGLVSTDRRDHAAARATLRGLHLADRRLDARRALAPAEWAKALARAAAAMVPGEATVLHDDPDIEREGATGAMARAMRELTDGVPGDVVFVSAYLVPDEALLEHARAHVARGGRLRILTNSLATNNQPLAHAAYQASRRELLEAGVELYELRADAWSRVLHQSPGSESAFLALHAKSAVFGEELCLVGSMNLDPRSMVLNTEMGVLVRSRELTAHVRRCLERELAPRNAWRVELEPDGRLRWSHDEAVQHSEPEPEPGARIRQGILGLLPVRGET